MAGFWKELKENHLYKKAFKRLSSRGSGEVLDWAMTTLWATQQGLEGFRATTDAAALIEARRGAISLLAATEVLLDKVAATGQDVG